MKPFNKILIDLYNDRKDTVNIFLLIVLNIIVFFNSLGNYFFIIDDLSSMLHTTRGILNIFITNSYGGASGGNYRPLEALSHMIDTLIYGNVNPFGRHLTNLILHIFNVIFIYKIGSYLTKEKAIGLVAGLLFSVSMINTYALSPVAWISGRPDLLVTFFSLFAYILFITSLRKKSILYYLASLVIIILALMSKEMAVTFPLIVSIHILIFYYSRNDHESLNIKYLNVTLFILLLSLIILLPIGIIGSPALLAKILTKDGILTQTSIDKIEFIRHTFVVGGGITFLLFLILYLIAKISQKAKVLINYLKPAFPYFLLVFAFLMVREIVLGGFGGVYNSSSGNVIFQHGLDSFMRDIFALLGFIWPVRIDFNLLIFNLQIEHSFIFYSVSILIAAGLILILYKLILGKYYPLLLSFLWIFITLMPVHNLIIPSWQFQAKYLYLPEVGFCIFVSILLFRLMKKDKKNFYKMGFSLILIILLISSVLIINHNKELGKDGEVIRGFVSDMKKYEAEVNSLPNLYFVIFPYSPVNTVSNIYITKYMNDLLNYTYSEKGYRLRNYDYNLLLFENQNDEKKKMISWENKHEFLLHGIDPANYFLIPVNPSFKDLRLEDIYQTAPHYKAQLLSSKDDTFEIESADLQVVKGKSKSNQSAVKIRLKDKLQNPGKRDLFFIYENSHFYLLDSLKEMN